MISKTYRVSKTSFDQMNISTTNQFMMDIFTTLVREVFKHIGYDFKFVIDRDKDMTFKVIIEEIEDDTN